MDEKQTEGAAATGPAKDNSQIAPGTAPPVPTEILRQLTKDDAGHASKAVKPAEEPAAAPTASAETTSEPASESAGQQAEPSKPAEDDDGLGDPQTDEAVDDIVSREADELLDAEDSQKESHNRGGRGFGARFKDFFYFWWHNKWARWITILVVLASIATVGAVPKLRYKVLNAAGVRASLSVAVLDNTTQLPLKNVTVSIEGRQASTDINGVAKVTNLRLGPATLTVQRIAFATTTQPVTVGWGSNPLGNVTLKAVGTQYIIKVTDYLSGKPLANVEATSNGIEALSDNTGKVTLTVDNQDAVPVPVAIILNGYRTEQLTLPAANSLTASVQLVTDRKVVFISKQSGHYDLYKVDVDGKNKQVLLAATGTENENISLLMSPDGTKAALVSTRDNSRDTDGYLLSTLTLVSIADGATTTLDHAEQIQLVDWVDHRLIYDEAAAGASAANPQRYKLISYDYSTSSRIQLASANQFNGIATANGVVYYAVSATDPSAQASFNKIRPDGSGKQTIYNQEVWSVFRTDYGTFSLQTPSGWYAYATGSGQLTKAGAPAAFVSRAYSDSPDGQRSLWVDTRDGQGVLLGFTLAGGKETTLQKQDGLTYPVYWLSDDTVIYSVVNRTETADYVLSLSGGTAHKVVDVTHTYGATQGS
ncbi:MAG TPA: hypothetical protein VLG11_03205 [Candidatus Saccharimonadales bacterium]|nr:hypothetical protein [Candidatus Saccharimonadales bacterium]